MNSKFVPMKRADSVAQIGNHSSKTEASIQSVTTETEHSLTGTTNKDMQHFCVRNQKGEELRKCWKEANRCFSTARDVFFVVSQKM